MHSTVAITLRIILKKLALAFYLHKTMAMQISDFDETVDRHKMLE